MSETVTQSLLRVIDLPGGGRFALVTLDNGQDHRRPNTFGPAGLDALGEALDRAAGDGVVGVGITGRPWIFCAGADLELLASIGDRDEVLAVGRLGHRVLGMLGSSPVPTFAFVNGVALGGGLEAALHCTYRTVSATAAPIGLPEVGLGIVPAWGGAYLLPNLVGVETATRVIVESAVSGGRTLTGPQAAALGLFDAVFEPADFLQQSLVWAARVLRGEIEVHRPAVDRDETRWNGVVAAARGMVDARLHGAAPAPYRALDLIAAARTSDPAAAFDAEDQALADLLGTDQTRAALYAFGLTQFRAKRPTGAPDRALAARVQKVGVVGAGLMASQLALLFARKLEVPVVMTDLSQQKVDSGLVWIGDQVAGMVAKGRLSPRSAARLQASVTGTVDTGALSDADLVIEAVFEDLAVKKRMLTDLEPMLKPDCVIATNTSALSPSSMAEVLAHPNRLVGMHFFNPVSRMPLLEVVTATPTDERALATAFAVGRELGKSCVAVRDAPGFAVNRLLSRMFCALMQTVDEGTPIPVADAALDPLGLPMSPFTLLAMVGPAVHLHVNETLASVWPDRFAVSPTLRRLVEAGVRNVLTDGVLVTGVEPLLQQGDRPSEPGQVLQRVRDAIADEARRMVDSGVVASAADLDTCLLLGAGWPAHLGGVTPWLDRTRSDGEARFNPPGVASAG